MSAPDFKNVPQNSAAAELERRRKKHNRARALGCATRQFEAWEYPFFCEIEFAAALDRVNGMVKLERVK